VPWAQPRLDRFFVSDYLRTPTPRRQTTENIIPELPLSATPDFPVPRRRQKRRPPARKHCELQPNQQLRNLPFSAAHFSNYAKSRRINPLAAK
jgi:hypothetical protein